MKITTLLIDLDDTLYPASSGVWQVIRQRIDAYICSHFHLSLNDAQTLRDDLFRRYGTTMRGLQMEHHVDEEEYLSFVHDVPLKDHLAPNHALKEMLARIPYRKVIITNADIPHAQRVLNLLGIRDQFEMIIDIHRMAPYCKPMPEAFEKALTQIGEEASACVLVEDSKTNLLTASRMGFFTVHIGNDSDCSVCDARIQSIMELEQVLDEKELGC